METTSSTAWMPNSKLCSVPLRNEARRSHQAGGTRFRADKDLPGAEGRARTRFGWLGIAALIDLLRDQRPGHKVLWMAGNRGFDRLASRPAARSQGALD